MNSQVDSGYTFGQAQTTHVAHTLKRYTNARDSYNHSFKN